MASTRTTWLAGILCLGVAFNTLATDHAGGRNYPDGSGGVNAPYQVDKPYVVLVSIDGFRWDFPDLYPTPTLSRLASGGARAERLRPAWPTLTFPNHYSMATGLTPASHGLVGNDFFDPAGGRWYSLGNRQSVEDGSFYGGEPIWVTAETQGMVAASFYWVGSEADIQGVHPTHWRSYKKDVAGTERVDQALAWLAEPAATRPHLVTLYFEEVDDYAHWHGIGSEKFLQAMRRVDGYFERLLTGIAGLPHGNDVYVVIVSDHGQMGYRDSPPLLLNEHINLQAWSVIEGGCYVYAWAKDGESGSAGELADIVNRTWDHGRAYTRETAPAAWQIDANPRFPDLVFQADPGYAVLSKPSKSGKISKGDHGWAPDTPEMHGVFMINGPGIRAGQDLGEVRSVDIYPLLLNLLGLTPPAHMDGGPAHLGELLGLTPEVAKLKQP